MACDMWQQFLHLIHEECGSRVVETWFKAITLHSWDAAAKTIFLEAPNAFVRDWVIKHYLPLIQVHMGRLLHVEMPRISFLELAQSTTNMPVAQLTDMTTKIVPARVVPAGTRSDKTPVIRRSTVDRSYQVNSQYVFETFVVGPSNSLAYAAAHAVTERPGILYNPLFIYGDSGLGKTHLLHAIGNGIKANNKDAVVLYQTADRFVTEFINAIRFNKVHKFKEKYQRIDILLIDDIQFISNKEQTQEAFFHIFNSLYEAHKQLVFSSDTFPQDMRGVAERLQSRLASGLVTDIHLPSFETKIAIIKKKAVAHGQEFSDDVAHYIALQVVSNVRELEGMLVRVMAFASLTQQKISLELAQKVLHRVTSVVKPTRVHNELDSVVRVVAAHYLCTPDDLYAKSRNQGYVQARHVAMFLIKHLTGKSLRAIGDFLGGRDHSTVVHGVEKVAHEMAAHHSFRMRIEQLEREIRSSGIGTG